MKISIQQLVKTGVVSCYDTPNRLMVIDPEGGEVTFEIGYLPGIHKMENLLPYVRNGDEIQTEGGIKIYTPNGDRARPIQQGTFETGANPDFAPTNYTEAEIRLRKLMKDVQKQSNALEKRKLSFEKASENAAPGKPEAKTEPVEVVETPEPIVPDNSELEKP